MFFGMAFSDTQDSERVLVFVCGDLFLLYYSIPLYGTLLNFMLVHHPPNLAARATAGCKVQYGMAPEYAASRIVKIFLADCKHTLG